jgi:hypothetical protein
MKLKFKEVLPNPYRDLKGNPPLKEKIAELKSSISTTGFWDNVVVRKNKAGKYERAYGEHRVRAAIEAGLIEGDFIVKELSDAMMIQIMDNENREVYASSPASVIESVKAVVTALTDGTIPAFEVDPKTNAQHIRYAPSYVAGKEPVAGARAYPYTSTLIAKFLGRVYLNGRADTAVEAALNFLHLKEMGTITNAILVKDNQPITARKLFDITADIKKRTETITERRGKTQAELNKLREQQLAAQAKAKADAKQAEDEHNALLKKEADARREENNRKADALAKQIKEKDERAKAKEILNQLAMAGLEEKVAQKKAWEAEQRVQDAYLPIRRDVEVMLGKFETMVSERNPLREDVKALAKLKALRPEDRKRLRTAAVAVADWFSSWVAAQFAPLPTAKAELKEMAKKEKSKRSKET